MKRVTSLGLMAVAWLTALAVPGTAAAAPSDGPCPIELDLQVTSPESAMLTAVRPTSAWCPVGVTASVEVRIDGLPAASSAVGARAVRIPIQSRPGSEVAAVGTALLGRTVVGRAVAAVRLAPLEAPDSPRGLHAWGATASSLALGWEPPANASRTGPLTYRVRTGDRVLQVSGTEVVIEGLAPDTVHFIAVTAQGTAGESNMAFVAARTAATGDLLLAEPGTDPQLLNLVPGAGASQREATVAEGAVNSDGTADLDGDPATVRQDVDGRWLRDDDVVAGEDSPIVRVAGRTDAGALTDISVTSTSPSVSDVDVDERTGRLVARLHPGARAGSVIITVSAPEITRGGLTYEPIAVSRRIVVRAPDLGSWPTAVDGQVTDAVT